MPTFNGGRGACEPAAPIVSEMEGVGLGEGNAIVEGAFSAMANGRAFCFCLDIPAVVHVHFGKSKGPLQGPDGSVVEADFYARGSTVV